MPHKRKRGGSIMTSNARKYGGAHRHHKGGAWYNTLWDGIKKIAGPINSVLRDTKVISKGLSAFGQSGLASAADKLGYGHRRRYRGGSISAVKF